MAYLQALASEWRVTNGLLIGPDVRVESDRWLSNRSCGKTSEWREADGLPTGPAVRSPGRRVV